MGDLDTEFRSVSNLLNASAHDVSDDDLATSLHAMTTNKQAVWHRCIMYYPVGIEVLANVKAQTEQRALDKTLVSKLTAGLLLAKKLGKPSIDNKGKLQTFDSWKELCHQHVLLQGKASPAFKTRHATSFEELRAAVQLAHDKVSEHAKGYFQSPYNKMLEHIVAILEKGKPATKPQLDIITKNCMTLQISMC